MRGSDIRMERRGERAYLHPLSRRGLEWIDGNVPADPWQWFMGALAIEPRYAEVMFAAMCDAGLVVE